MRYRSLPHAGSPLLLSRRNVLVAMLGAIATTGTRPAWAASALKFAIALVPTEVAAQAYYANDLGYFAKNGLAAEVIALQNGPAIISAVLSGSIDIGFSNVFSLIVAHDKGLPVKVLFGTDVNGESAPTNGILCVLDSSPIRTAGNLAGKTIAVSSLSNTNYYATRKWVDTNGGDSAREHYIELPLPEMADAVSSGRVDAASMDSANVHSRHDLRVLGATYLAIAPRFIAGAWFTTPQWIAQHGDEVQRFTKAIRDVSVWANAHPREAVEIYAKHSRFTLSDLAQSPRPVFVTTTAGEARLLQPLIDLAARYGAIQSTFQAGDLLAGSASTGDA